MNTLRKDFTSSIVVFFVALPLCLGIALASGAPLFSGILAGIVGGIIVGLASGSALGVSGPAAGLAVIVLMSIQSLGSWQAFLLAVFLAGVFQLLMGLFKTGFIAYFFPSSVIKGMLSGIGILIILKQIPHALGYDKDAFGDFSFFQMDGETTLSTLNQMLSSFEVGAIIISLLSISLMIVWDGWLGPKHRFFRLVQGPIIAVLLAVFLNFLFKHYSTSIYLGATHLVNLPKINGFSDFIGQLVWPDFTAISHWMTWKVAIVLALVASLETLLCVEATDKLDPHKRITPPNRELKAQGLGNMISGLIGGLPVTQVIIRSSANITFGGQTKHATIFHGIWLLLAVTLMSSWLNTIPLACLAAILIIVGYKLAKPKLFVDMYKLGWEQFTPFVATIVGILSTDLLQGIIIGIGFGIFFTLHHSFRNAYYMRKYICSENNHLVSKLVLAEEVSFFNKASIIKALDTIPNDSKVIIDCSKSKAIDHDVVEIIKDFKLTSANKNVTVETIDFIEPKD